VNLGGGIVPAKVIKDFVGHCILLWIGVCVRRGRLRRRSR